MAEAAVGIDIGGTKIAVGAVAPDGRLLRSKRLTSAGTTLAGLQAAAEEVAAGLDVAGVGVGVCELVDADGRIRSHESVAWTETELEAALGPVAIEADVYAAALAEARFGAGRSFSSFVYVTVGTGISHCLVVGGAPYRGAHGCAQLIGSAPVRFVCPQCGRDVRFVLEDVASGAALARSGSAAESSSEVLGSFVALLVNVLDPEGVVIGGGLGSAGGAYWEALVRGVRGHVWAEHVLTCRSSGRPRRRLGSDRRRPRGARRGRNTGGVMTYRIYGDEPLLVRHFEATRVLWGDETSGQVSDLVYGRGTRISGFVYLLGPGHWFGASETWKPLYDQHRLYYVVQGRLAIHDPESGEVAVAGPGEGVTWRGERYHYGYNVGDDEVVVLDWFAPAEESTGGARSRILAVEAVGGRRARRPLRAPRRLARPAPERAAAARGGGRHADRRAAQRAAAHPRDEAAAPRLHPHLGSRADRRHLLAPRRVEERARAACEATRSSSRWRGSCTSTCRRPATGSSSTGSTASTCRAGPSTEYWSYGAQTARAMFCVAPGYGADG